MAKFRSQKNSFISGEWGGAALGRTDLPQYQHACKLLRNMIPLPGGGAVYRPGTRHATTDDNPLNLIPFIASQTEAYCVALGGNHSSGIRIFRKDPTLTGLLAGITLQAATITDNTPGGLPLIEGDSYDYRFEWQYTQSVDILYLVHPFVKPHRILRTAADAFTLQEFDYGLTGASLRDAWPYRPKNTTATTIAVTYAGAAPIAAGTTVTLTASTAIFANAHVGALFKFNYGMGDIGCVRITSVTNGTTATGTVIFEIDSEVATAEWWESAWSEYRGWPSSVCFYQQRLVYGGPYDSLFFSNTAAYNTLSIDTLAEPRTQPTGEQAFTIELSSQQLNRIQWVSSEKTLVVGTSGDEFIIEPGPADGFGCENVRVTVQSHYGSTHHQPQRVGDELLFISSGGTELRSFVFNFEQNAYVADPLQMLFDEYPKNEARSFNYGRQYRRFAWDSSRKVLWCCDTAGNLFGMTRDRRLQVLAWHTHELGGADKTVYRTFADYDPLLVNMPHDPANYVHTGGVVSLCVMPDPFRGKDEVWLCVPRRVNGTWMYHVEIMTGWSYFGDSVYDPAYATDLTLHLDAAQSQGSATHLNGAQVSVLFAGTHGRQAISGKTVSAGTASFTETIPSGNDYTLCGFPFNGVIIPVRPEAGSQIGSAQGAIKRIHQAVVRFYKTISGKVGADASNLDTIEFREGSTPMGKSAEFCTGDKAVKVDCDYDRDGYLYILQDQPLPFAVVSVVSEGVTYD